MQWLANPDVQALIATLAGFVWLTQVQATLPPQLESRIPAPLLTPLKIAAGNWGNAKNTQAPLGPASPLASIAVTALCLVAGLLPLLASKLTPAPVVVAPAMAHGGAHGGALPHDVTPATLAADVTP